MDETGLSRQTLNEWARRPGCPRKPRGRTWAYAWPDWNEWRFEEGRRNAAASAAPADLEEAKARKMAAEAEIAEFELARLRGDMVALGDVDGLLASALDPIRAGMLAVPSKWAPLLVGLDGVAVAQAALEPLVAAALQDWSGSDRDG